MSKGGIYVNTAAQFNTKCVIFASLLCLGYWFTPQQKNIYLLPAIFTVAYVAMAWYDELYDCKDKLYSGSRSWGAAILDSIFKPQLRQMRDTTKDSQHSQHSEPPKGKHLVSNQEAIYRRYTYLFHVLVMAPLFILVGYYKYDKLYAPLLWFTILGMVYHIYRSFVPRPEQSHIIYPTHVLGFLPLALYVGWKGAQANKLGFNGLLWLGIVGGAYHLLRYIQLVPQLGHL